MLSSLRISTASGSERQNGADNKNPFSLYRPRYFFPRFVITGRGGFAIPSPIKKLVCGGWL